jgi:hypothetical protein
MAWENFENTFRKGFLAAEAFAPVQNCTDSGLEKRDTMHLGERAELRVLEHRVARIEQKVDRIHRLLLRILGIEEAEGKAVTSTLTFVTPSGGNMGADLNVLLTDAPGMGVYQEFQANGNPVASTGVVTFASSDTSVATVDQNGQLAYLTVNKLDANGAPIPVQITGTNVAMPTLAASANLFITASGTGGTGTAVSATLTLIAGGTPAAAAAKARKLTLK